jgi:O-antigen/teichoic acid export membrane protein
MQRTQTRSVVEDTTAYLIATIVIQNIAFLIAVYSRNVLGPEAMGVWILMQVFLNYVAYGNLGMLNAVCREIPILRGQDGQEQRIENIKNVGFSYIVAVGILTGILGVVGVLLWRGKLSNYLFYGLLAASMITVLQRVNSYLVQLLHVEKRFAFVSKFKIYSAVINALLVVIMTWKWKLYGFFGASILSYIFNISYLCIFSKFNFRFIWDKSETKKLLKFGTPLLALTSIGMVLMSIDRISIVKLFGLKAVGIYSIATMAGNYLMMLPIVFQTVLYPRTLEKFGNPSSYEGRLKYSILPGKLLVVYFTLCIGLIWLMAPILCHTFMPKYVDGLAALKILVFGYCFMALIQQLNHVLLGYGNHLLMLPVVVVLVLGGFGVNYLISRSGGGITQIAASMSAILLIDYLCVAYFAWKPIYGFNQYVRQILVTLTPLGLGFVLLLLLDLACPSNAIGWITFKVLLYGVAWLAMLFALEDQLGTLKALKEAFVIRFSTKTKRVVAEEDLITVEK